MRRPPARSPRRAETTGGTPAGLAAKLRREREVCSRVAREAGSRIES